MRILFIQVSTSHLGAQEKVFPLGLARLSGLVPKGWPIRVLDMNLSPDPWEDLKAVIEEFRPEVGVLSFRNLDPLAGQMTSYLAHLKTTARLFRRLAPQAFILAGGPAFTLFARRLMEEIPEIDFGVMGEGERVFPELMEHLGGGSLPPGTMCRKGLEIQTVPGRLPADLEHLPPLDLERWDPERYANLNHYVASIGLEGKRGCHLGCTYCLYPFLGGRQRLRPPADIVDEMERLNREHGIGLFHFTDPVVNDPPDHFLAMCREIRGRGLKVGWTGFFREDAFNPELVEEALEAGLSAVYFSADGLTDAALGLLGKNLTMAQVLQASKVAAQSGVLTVKHFLVNLPGETETLAAEAKTNLFRILEIFEPSGNLGAVVFNNVRLYPDAPLTRSLIRSGHLPPDRDLLFPVYFDPPRFSHLRHELEALCHTAGAFSRLGLGLPPLETS